MIPLSMYSMDTIDIYPVDTLQSQIIFSDIDSNSINYEAIVFGKIEYINGKFEKGKLKIPLDSVEIYSYGDTETFMVNSNCNCGDTLSISIERTFQNALAKDYEPNYTAVSKICFRGFEYSIVFPMRVLPSEKDIRIAATFKINLHQIFTKLHFNEKYLSEFNTELKISLITEKNE